jgi:ferredoxin/flavodoxin---NADP+ reductase
VIPNVGGRVTDADGGRVPGLYTAGWIKRGPSGVIGTNKKDATETVELLLEDAAAGRLPRSTSTAADVDGLLEERGVEVVTHDGWQGIDAAERDAGEPHGRPRVKLSAWEALLAAARDTRG